MEITILASATNSDTAALPNFVQISVSSAVEWSYNNTSVIEFVKFHIMYVKCLAQYVAVLSKVQLK